MFSSYFVENVEEFGVSMGSAQHLGTQQELQTGSGLPLGRSGNNGLFRLWAPHSLQGILYIFI